MGLVTKEVEVRVCTSQIHRFIKLGYIIPQSINKYGKIIYHIKEKLKIKVEDLSHGSEARVIVICDKCGRQIGNNKNGITYQAYLKSVKADGKYYCQRCIKEMYATENSRISRMQNSTTFYDWCIINSREDILDRWDYEINKCNPNDISFSSSKKYWFKCPNGIHESELKSIDGMIRRNNKIICKKCSSFAYLNINKLGKDFLEKYWDYDKNTLDPWAISKSSEKKIWIKCQKKDYHGSYQTSCSHFSSGKRCPLCSKHGGKVHKLDSLGTSYPESVNVWSNINEMSPYDFPVYSEKKVWWKCPNGNHDDFKRTVATSVILNFRCPECNYSKGENRISLWLAEKSICYESGKTFKNLCGVGGRPLSYDFYLPKYNLLVEYQGQFHDGKGCYIKERFEKQQEHDNRKKQYAIDNNIKFLEIWYWDFDNIEKILSKSLEI